LKCATKKAYDKLLNMKNRLKYALIKWIVIFYMMR